MSRTTKTKRSAAAKAKPRPKRRSILDDVAADPRRHRRWEITAEQRKDVDEVFAAEKAGTVVCGCTKLARILKARYNLPWAVASIRDRLLEIKAATL